MSSYGGLKYIEVSSIFYMTFDESSQPTCMEPTHLWAFFSCPLGSFTADPKSHLDGSMKNNDAWERSNHRGWMRFMGLLVRLRLIFAPQKRKRSSMYGFVDDLLCK